MVIYKNIYFLVKTKIFNEAEDPLGKYSDKPLKNCGLSAFTSGIQRYNLHYMTTLSRSWKPDFVQHFCHFTAFFKWLGRASESYWLFWESVQRGYELTKQNKK